MIVCPIHNDTVSTLHACMQEHVEAGLGGRPEVGVRGLLQLADEEPQARLTLEAQEAARAAFSPAEECRESMLNLRCPSSWHKRPACLPTSLSQQQYPCQEFCTWSSHTAESSTCGKVCSDSLSRSCQRQCTYLQLDDLPFQANKTLILNLTTQGPSRY